MISLEATCEQSCRSGSRYTDWLTYMLHRSVGALHQPSEEATNESINQLTHKLESGRQDTLVAHLVRSTAQPH